MLTNVQKVEIVTKVIEGFKKQRAFSIMKSVNNDTPVCFYRSPNGTKCAIGMLISDEMYKPSFEGSTVHTLIRDNKISFDGTDEDFYSDLQRIHDTEYHNGKNWHRMMKNLRTFKDSFV